MFIYFNKNKCRYNQGQLAPVFIVILVVLLIMAIVTVNLFKVGMVKTDSANAVDAGGLAAGSVMANTFNAVASASAQMEASYWEFYASVSASFVIALLYLGIAQGYADAGAVAAGIAKTEAIAAETCATEAEASAGAAEGSASTALALACVLPCMAIPYASAAASSIGAAIGSAGAAITSIGLAIKGMTIEAIPAIESAIINMQWFVRTAWSILIATTAFAAAQWYFYGIIRDMAQKGRESGIELGHKFAFMNSGIGTKLKEGSQREGFSDFLDDLEYDPEYTYPWEDGQGREHSVTVNVTIDPVDTFDLKVAALPLIVEVPLLGYIIYTGNAAITSLETALTAYGVALGAYGVAEAQYIAAEAAYTAAEVSYTSAIIALSNACGWWIKWVACETLCGWFLGLYLASCATATALLGSGLAANGTGLTANAAGLLANADGLLANGDGLLANAAAITAIISIYIPLAAAWAGLLPGLTIRSTSLDDAITFIICWIDDLIHNRLVRVDTAQHHEGADLGLWQTRYPDTSSYSVVDFQASGQIHPAVLRYDPSIIETDKIGSE